MKFCSICGSKLSRDEKFCKNCGTEVPVTEVSDSETVAPAAADVNPDAASKKLRVGLLVFSIITTVISTCFFFVGFPFGLAALILTIVASAVETAKTEKTLVLIAKILNIVSVCLSVISSLAYIPYLIYVISALVNGGI